MDMTKTTAAESDAVQDALTAYCAVAAREAEAAFYRTLAEDFPAITTGDMTPLAEWAFTEACHCAAGAWLVNNS